MNNIIKSALEYYDKNQEQILKLLKDVYFLKFGNHNDRVKYIIFYDKDKKKIFESSYQFAGIYISKKKTWKWAWSLAYSNKENTFISRKVLDYAFNLDTVTELELRSRLLNSNIKIINENQIDINLAIISYISKIPFILKLPYINNTFKKTEYKQHGDLYEYQGFFLEDQKNIDNSVMLYWFMVDYKL
jgi:hypothetical protein